MSTHEVIDCPHCDRGTVDRGKRGRFRCAWCSGTGRILIDEPTQAQVSSRDAQTEGEDRPRA